MASAEDLRRRREQESAFAFLYDMARQQDEQLAAEGRRPVFGGLLSKEPVAGVDTVRYEGVGNMLAGLLSPVARAVDAPLSAYRGTIPQEDMINEAMNSAGLASTLGGMFADLPQGALASNALRSAKLNDFSDNEMTFYHGSPYDFREFNLDHIGKGEGQQDLGRGFSLTDDEGVARLYMNPGSRWGDLEAIKRYEEAGPGRWYEVAVKARPDQFLDFKKPWKDQVPEGTPLHDKIQERMAKSYADDPEMQELFQQANLSSVWRDGFGMEDAAMQSGFVGNKLQGFSGGTQFTVFDPAEIKIKKVFDDEGRQMPIAPPNDNIVSANASRSAGLLASGFDNKDFVEPGKQFMRPMPDPDNDRFAPSDIVMAQRILDMRADGRAGEVTDEMMTQADPAFMFDNTPLPMDAAARMDRARAAGFDADGYHGTVVDHASLKPSVMGKYGPGVYTADGPEFAGDFAGKVYGKDEYLDGGKVLPMSIKSNPAPDEYRANAEALKRSAANPFDGAGEFTGYLDDNGFTGVKVGNEQTTVNPANMRSQFARFDPEFAHLRNLSSANASTSGGLLATAASNAERMAKHILELRAAGRAGEVTDEMMAQADPQYMFANTPLPMDEAARMARAEAAGFGGDLYHGTTHEFSQFGGGDTRNIEGHFGAGDYFTDSAKDASDNYAGDGPDLTLRIQERAEQIADEMDVDYDDPAAIAAAKAELRGDTDGLIIPSRIKGNEVNVMPHTRGAPTTLEREMPSASQFEADARVELGPDADKWDVYDLAQEMADDAALYTEPAGPLADFAESIRSQGYRHDFDAEEALAPVYDGFAEGVISAYDLDRQLRDGPLADAANPETGGLLGNDVIRQAFADAGYDNIRMSANAQGWNMPIPEGTSHIIASNPANIRSRFARFDPEFAHLANLNAANASTVGGLLAQSGVSDKQAEKIETYLKKVGLLQ